jgi:hypothetical protein
VTAQQKADLLLAAWQRLSPMPPSERLRRIDELRLSLPRPDDEYEFTVGLVREAMALTTVSAHDSNTLPTEQP